MSDAKQVSFRERHQRELGAALALVVVALFLLSGLAATAFFLAYSERRVGREFVRFHQASTAADAGAYAPLSRWDIVAYNRLEIGASAPFSGENPDGTGSYEGAVTRLGTRLFLVTSEGGRPHDNVRQRAATLMRLRPLQLIVAAALDIRGPLDIGEAVRIRGFDQPPYGWNCPPVKTPLPAVRIPSPDSGIAPWSGCDASRCLEGDPLFEALPPVPGSGVPDLGGSTLADLRAIAAHVLPGGNLRVQPVVTNGTCVTANPTNWGDPYDPGGACGDYFPAVYSMGDLVVRAGQGQGILVVDGDLTVWGDFHYFGVVIVLGSLSSVGTGSRITGAVIVSNVDLEPQSLGGMTMIQYSSCAIDKSLNGSDRGVLLRERSWLDMY